MIKSAVTVFGTLVIIIVFVELSLLSYSNRLVKCRSMITINTQYKMAKIVCNQNTLESGLKLDTVVAPKEFLSGSRKFNTIGS